MANLYGNQSDFWTSDEEDALSVADSKFNFAALYQLRIDNSASEVSCPDFGSVSTPPLDTLNWIPLISQPESKLSPFDILDGDIVNDDYDLYIDDIEEQLYKGILDSSEDENEDELELLDTKADLPEYSLVSHVEKDGSLIRGDLAVVSDFKSSDADFDKTPQYKLLPQAKNGDTPIVPLPDEKKNYIRTKWSVLDNSPPPILENLLIDYPFELDDFQKRAIYQLTNMKHVFVAAHTSSGKTVVAEYAVALAIFRGERAIYTSPIKALSNQKYREFKKRFGNEAVGIITGDVSCNIWAPCLIVTTEILRNLLYRGDSIIGQLGVVIFDEIHYINDLSRGVVWEEVIIMLPKTLQLVMLSATVPNYDEFADWIGGIMQREVITIFTSHRPTPLIHFLYIYNKMFLLIDSNGFNKDAYHSMYKYATLSKSASSKKSTFKGNVQKLQRLLKLLEANDKLPVVLFCFNRAKCEMYAKEMPNLNLAYTQVQRSKIHLFIKESLATISESDRNLPQVKNVIKLLQRGIGVHHSGLLPIIKEIVEILFSRGLIKVLFATETFAMGVNMPARSVVFTSIHKHDGQKSRHLTASEYTQMAGRAGRRGLDSFGNVYIFCPDEPPDLQDLTNMMMEKSTKLESRFRITYNMLLQMQSREHMNITEMMLKSFRERDKMKNIPILKRDCLRRKQELLSLPKVECIYGEPSIDEYYKLHEHSKLLATDLNANLWNHKEKSQIFKPGRVLMIHSVGFCKTSCYGCILEFKSSKTPELRMVAIVPEFCDENVKDVIVGTTTSPLGHSEVHFVVCDSISIKNVSFIYNNVITIKDSGSLPQSAKSHLGTVSISSVASELHVLIESNKLQLLVFNKQLKQTSMQFYDIALRQRDVYHRLANNKCTNCHMREKHYEIKSKITNCQRDIEEIGEKLRGESLHAYSEMVSKLEVLKQLEFLNQDGKPTVKGRIATYLTTGDEITLTESLSQNVLKDLEPEECAAVLSAFVYNDKSPEKEAPAPTLAIQIARDKIIGFHNKIDVIQRSLDIYFSKEEFSALCNFSLSYVVYQWAKGMDFNEIMKLTELQEGHIVRAITRLDELCRKIGQVAAINGDEALKNKIEKVSNAIRRDIVFAPSLYLS